MSLAEKIVIADAPWVGRMLLPLPGTARSLS